ncbi:biotin-dependent carboxyltransferase family protein [Paenibacillus doosanensis]|uniref:5-oxoprolinase subunit C family protein n=1 Tax=Paenibacillus doosanensis TaxID=1229154 RepID=UPI00217F9FED|nr:biotin-dependent carboxyltransferase family protein [Paenibacillus doosanensis]MCS7460342.1 biotin-dependent carboxyltransferase family protein [Paenibacillus doosanensis]
MTIHVRKPGLLTTLQDAGRYGYQKYGVIVSGPMDSFAHQTANLLVGNDAKEAALEATLIGPTLYFAAPALIAVCGPGFTASIDGVPAPLWRPVYVNAGATLLLGSSREGCRCYIAVSGGFDVPEQLGSRSTYLRAGLGGLEGRALKEGDRLRLKDATELGENIMRRLHADAGDAAFQSVKWRVSYEMMPAYNPNPEIRVMPGAQSDLFDAAGLEALFSAEFKVQPQSDRMGYRLAGQPLYLREPLDMLSEPVTFGTVQVPPDGNPIVLMADRQTTGGYPKIAQVLAADLPLLAQAQIGSSVRFRQADLIEAQESYLLMEWNLRNLRKSIQMYFF